MKEMQIFKNDDFGKIRATEIDGEPWFVGKDIAEVLGYSNPRKAMGDHVDDEDKGVTKCDTLGGQQNLVIINESGLYSLILGSKLPTAKKFKRWVTSEVLPAIRRHGAYMTDEKAFDVTHNSSGLADLLQQAADQLKQKDIQIERMKPKALFADAVATADTSILVGQLAKILRQNGVQIGQNRLFNWLRENGYLGKAGNNRNLPTQRAMDLGLFEIKESTFQNPDGSVRITRTPKVTGKGQIYFIEKLCGDAREEA
ncbi:MAG: phage antirepressor [Clostridiales bacterium]|nr:phage antirepressor [Clostridiales bacterium]